MVIVPHETRGVNSGFPQGIHPMGELPGHHIDYPGPFLPGPIQQPAPEEKIVWLVQPRLEKYPYLREAEIFVVGIDSWATRPRRVPGKLVAYSTAYPGVRFRSGRGKGGYLKRVWYVLKHDPYEPGCDAAHGPIEAVDPRTIHPGKPSSKEVGK